MSNRHKKNGTYVRELDGFGGLDLTGVADQTTPRFSRLDNMWRDYHAGEGDTLETFPGFRILTTLPGVIHGIWFWPGGVNGSLVVHAGTSLYICDYMSTDSDTMKDSPEIVFGGDGALADATSHAFLFGGALYILDGSHYFRLSTKNAVPHLEEVRNLYIPMTYSDGSAYEAANILSEYVYNRYRIGAPTSYPCASAGLGYRIVDVEAHTCEVTGYLGDQAREILYIPATADIAEINYRVIRVGEGAFSGNTTIKKVYVGEGVEEISASAFRNCSSLEYVYLPDNLLHIGNLAFSECEILHTMVIGRGLESVGQQILKDSLRVKLYLHGDEGTCDEAVEAELLSSAEEAAYISTYPAVFCRFPCFESIEKIEKVTLDGQEVARNAGNPHYVIDYTDDGSIGGIVVHTDGTYLLSGRELVMTLRLSSSAAGCVEGNYDFAAASCGYDGSTHAAMAHCTCAAIYDGRVFFTGNPALPATVFYCARDLTGTQNPAYVGIYNYFLCGDNNIPVTALLPTSSYLAVFTSDTRGGGSVTYYCGSDTGRDLVPRIYLAKDQIVGRGCTGPAVNFRDDPVFLSCDGLEAVACAAVNTERSLHHRSTLIDAALAAYDPRSVMHAVWEGYLVLLYPDGEAYLADSRRTSGGEYEWYHLTGVGTYSDDAPVYRYADAHTGNHETTIMYNGSMRILQLHPDTGALPCGSDETTYEDVYPSLVQTVSDEGHSVVFSREGEAGAKELYLLMATGERLGGEFSRPTALGVCRDKLLFGCQNGKLCVVNTDRRGVMNAAQTQGYNNREYAKRWRDVINPEWYSYAGHRYTAGVTTLPDDCGVSNYTKSTQRGTTVFEMKTGVGHGFSLEVRLLRSGGTEVSEVLSAKSDGMDFAGFDFSQVNFGLGDVNTVTLNERSRRYLSKQYSVFSEGFAQPFGLRKISYTWQTEGKVKTT